MFSITFRKFTLEASLSSFYVALPGIGEVFYSKDMGLVSSRSNESAAA